MLKNPLKDIPNGRIFTTDKKRYKTICFFEIIFTLQGQSGKRVEQVYGFHVPVVREDDGLFYALCIEANQVTYGSTTKNAIARMNDLISFFAQNSLNKEGSWEKFLSNQMDKIYLNIFHEVKLSISIENAKRLDGFIEHDSPDSDIDHHVIHKIVSQIRGTLGSATISQKYIDHQFHYAAS